MPFLNYRNMSGCLRAGRELAYMSDPHADLTVDVATPDPSLQETHRQQVQTII